MGTLQANLHRGSFISKVCQAYPNDCLLCRVAFNTVDLHFAYEAGNEGAMSVWAANWVLVGLAWAAHAQPASMSAHYLRRSRQLQALQRSAKSSCLVEDGFLSTKFCSNMRVPFTISFAP